MKNSRTLAAAAAVVTALALLAAAVCVTALSRRQEQKGIVSDRLGGLLRPAEPEAGDSVTEEEREQERLAREPVTPEIQETLEASMLPYLSEGRFEDLDVFLAERQQMYRSGEGEELASVSDWDSRFTLLRRDTAAAEVLSGENGQALLCSFSDPLVLAAAAAWAPVSAKLDAYVDFSAAILPAPDAPDIALRPAELEDPAQQLRLLCSRTGGQYIDLAAFDMTLFGWSFRFAAAQDLTGCWRPVTLQCTDGDTADFPNRSTLLEMAGSLDGRASLDDVVHVAPRGTE